VFPPGDLRVPEGLGDQAQHGVGGGRNGDDFVALTGFSWGCSRGSPEERFERRIAAQRLPIVEQIDLTPGPPEVPACVVARRRELAEGCHEKTDRFSVFSEGGTACGHARGEGRQRARRPRDAREDPSGPRPVTDGGFQGATLDGRRLRAEDASRLRARSLCHPAEQCAGVLGEGQGKGLPAVRDENDLSPQQPGCFERALVVRGAWSRAAAQLEQSQ